MFIISTIPKIMANVPRIIRNFALKTLQVLWVGMEDVCASWVHQKCLSADIIEQYERGVEVEVCMQRQSQGGQATFTASIEVKKQTLHQLLRNQGLTVGLHHAHQGIPQQPCI